jgi:DNA recombination protein RmuC
MQSYLLLIGLFIGLPLGYLLAWFYAKAHQEKALSSALAQAGAELAMLNERVAQKNREADELRQRFQALENHCKDLQGQLMEEQKERARALARAEQLPDLKSKLEAREKEQEELLTQFGQLQTSHKELETLLDNERNNAREKLALLEEAAGQLKDAFHALSADALKSNNQAFLELARTTLEKYQSEAASDLENRQKAVEGLVAPVRETLEKYDKQIQALESSRQEAYGRLTAQVESLFASQQQLQQETGNLVKALRTPHVRGRWGEFTLRRVVEVAGMSQYCDFEEQPSVETESGKLRPDMVVRLPAGKTLVVDSKVPLHAYLEALEAAGEEQKKARLEAHVRHIRTHLQKLSSKSYWEQFEPTPEFVIMFIPGEAFYTAAVELAPQLFEEGVNQRVIIATPANLIPLLLTVGYGWRQEAIAANARKISEIGSALYDRVAVMIRHFVEMGSSLEKSVTSYNKMVGSLESRVLVSARKFKEYGATAKEDLEELATIDTVPRPLPSAEQLALPATDNSSDEPAGE